MPKEGHKSVTIPAFRWEQMQKYYKEHKAELRNRGIKSASALVNFWLSEKLIETR